VSSPAGFGRSPDRRKVFHYFKHSGWLLLTLYNIVTVDYHAAIGRQDHRALAYAPDIETMVTMIMMTVVVVIMVCINSPSSSP